MVKNLSANAGCRDTGMYVRETGSIPGPGRSPGGGNSNLLQYSCLENSTDRGAWQVIVFGTSKSQTQLSVHTYTYRVTKKKDTGSMPSC